MLLYYSVWLSELGIYIRWVFHSLDCMVTHWSVLVRVFCEVFIYTVFFCFYELKMPPLGLLIWTENAALRVAFMNWKRRLHGCYFESIMLPLWLSVWTENAASRVAFFPVNAASRVAPLNRKYSLWGGCFQHKILLPGLLFEKKMPPLWLLFQPEIPSLELLWWTENTAFITAFFNRKCRP